MHGKTQIKLVFMAVTRDDAKFSLNPFTWITHFFNQVKCVSTL